MIEPRRALIGAAVGVSLVYVLYRGLFTLNWVDGYAIALSWLLYGSELFSILLFWLYLFQVWQPDAPETPPVLHGRSVDVFIPTLNEDVALLRQTLEAAARMRYPHTVYLLDDGNRPEVARLAESLGAVYLARSDHRGAKAGNLNHALEHSDGEFVVVLDADHVPEPLFINRLIGHFRDERIAFTQSPHAFYNFDSFQASIDRSGRHYWDESSLFYRVIQLGRNRWNAAICAGSAVMLRRSALEEIGGFAVETITEDMHTGLRLHARGWKSVAVAERLVAGQAAPDVTTFHSQRLRWGEGNLAVLAHDNPLTCRGLTLTQRLAYLGTVGSWLSGFAKLGIYLSPILMLYTGISPVAEFSWGLIFITLCYLIITFTALKVTGRGHASVLHSELFGMMTFATQIRAAFRALFRARHGQFVVTSKRGPQITGQTGRVWPLILPQVSLGVIGVLALVWGWSRLAYGISDDVFKPLLASGWVLFHLFLIGWTLHRAYRPADRRFSPRHNVHLPIEYEPTIGPASIFPERTGGKRRFAVSVDLSENGVGMVAYDLLPRGTMLRVAIHGPDETVTCLAEIRSLTGLDQPGGARGYRYGAILHHLGPRQMDALSRICLHYAVSRRHGEYDHVRADTPLRRFTSWRRRQGRQRRLQQRLSYRFPALISTGSPTDEPFYTTTEDLSRDAFAAIVPSELLVGTSVPYHLPTPLGEVHGVAEVVRSEPFSPTQSVDDRPMHRCVFRYREFDGQGRTTLMTLTDPITMAPAESILVPRVRPRPRLDVRSIMLALLVLIPLVIIQIIPFEWAHRDDIFLRQVIDGAGLAPAEVERVTTIADRTLARTYPSTDRLVLLMAALDRVQHDRQRDAVTMILAQRAPDDRGLQVARAASLHHLGEHLRAEMEFEHWLIRSQAGSMSEAQLDELRRGAARAAVHAGRWDRAREHFRVLIDARPQDASLRAEFAGALLAANRPEEVPALFARGSIEPEGRRLRLIAFARMGDHARVMAEARELSLLDPTDREARHLYADALAAQEGHQQAQQIYQRLVHRHPEDRGLRVKLAQAANATGRYDVGRTEFGRLVREGDRSRPVIEGFIDALAGRAEEGYSLEDRQTVLAIVDPELLGSVSEDRLARLALVMARLGEGDRAAALAEMAVERVPFDPTVRKQAIDALVVANRVDTALRLIDRTAPGNERAARHDHQRKRLLIHAHLSQRRFDLAEHECRGYLRHWPDDHDIRILLADILSWQHDYIEAEEQLRHLPVESRTSPDVARRLAEFALWRGEHALALTRFEERLRDHFTQPDLWPGFIDAASGTSHLNAHQFELTRRIVDRTVEDDSILSVEHLSRLAWVLIRAGESHRVTEILDRVVDRSGDRPENRAELVGTLAAVGRFRDAIELLKASPIVLIEERFRLARLYGAVGDHAEAMEHLAPVLEQRPRDREPRLFLAATLVRMGKHEQADQIWGALQTDFPGDPEIDLHRAEIALEQTEHDPKKRGETLSMFEALLSREVDRERVWRGWAEAASGIDDLEPHQELTALRIARTAQTASPSVVAPLVRVLLRLGEGHVADALLDHALARPITQSDDRERLAMALEQAHRFEDVLDLYKGVDPDPDWRHRLARIALQAGKSETAIRHAHHASQQAPMNPTVARTHAIALTRHRQYEKAHSLFPNLLDVEDHGPFPIPMPDRHFALDARSSEVRESLERLAARVEHGQAWEHFIEAIDGTDTVTPTSLALARRTADQMIQIGFTDSTHLTRLAAVLHREGDMPRATGLLDLALRRPPREPLARRHLVEQLSRMDRLTDAEAVVRGSALFTMRQVGDPRNLDRTLTALERRLQAGLRASPEDGELCHQLADILAWKGEYAQAARLYEKVLAHQEQEPPLEKWAWCTLWAGHPERVLDRLTRQRTSSRELVEALAVAVIASPRGQLGKDTKVIIRRTVEFTLERHEWEVESLCRLGLAVAVAGDHVLCERAFDIALRRRTDPHYRRAVQLHRAVADAELGRFDRIDHAMNSER